jgi:hypothetical protein
MWKAFALRIIMGAAVGVLSIPAVIAQPRTDQPTEQAQCPADHDRLADILKKSVKQSGGPTNGGFDNNEWAVIVNQARLGVCNCVQWQES